MPATASASSRCPFPATPATATISPARTSSDTSFSARPPRSPTTLTSWTPSITSPTGDVRSSRWSAAISRPTMSAASERYVESAVDTVVTFAPARRTVTRSATAITS